eukprot:749275-Rhodomonas_salina.3
MTLSSTNFANFPTRMTLQRLARPPNAEWYAMPGTDRVLAEHDRVQYEQRHSKTGTNPSVWRYQVPTYPSAAYWSSNSERFSRPHKSTPLASYVPPTKCPVLTQGNMLRATRLRTAWLTLSWHISAVASHLLCYEVLGTENCMRVPATVLRVPYAMPGTGIGYAYRVCWH